MRVASLMALLVVVSLVACSMSPRASLTAKQRDNHIDFEISTHGVNGLLGLRVWQADTKELLWDVNLNYYQEARLAYGQVPTDFRAFNGGKNSATQNFPIGKGKPRPLQPSGRFFVSVDCQYDTFMAASSRTFYFSLTTDTAVRVVEVSRVEEMRPDALPKTQ